MESIYFFKKIPPPPKKKKERKGKKGKNFPTSESPTAEPPKCRNEKGSR